MHTQTHTPTTDRWFADPDTLTCPGCGERPVRAIPPGYWQVRDGLAVPLFSHSDATPLCRTRAGVVAEPIETTR